MEGAAGIQIKKACPFPAPHMLAIIQFGLHPDTSASDIRKCACLMVQFAFFARADCGWLLLANQVLLHHDTTFYVNVPAKNIERAQAAPLSRLSAVRFDPDNLFMHLQRKWQRIRCQDTASDFHWSFQQEEPAPTSSIMSTWLREIMTRLDLIIPPGVSYTGHSLRRGGASAAHAIDVSLPRIMAWGLWAYVKTAISYLDTSMMPTEAAKIFW